MITDSTHASDYDVVLALCVRYQSKEVVRAWLRASLVEHLVKLYTEAPERVKANAITAVAHFFLHQALPTKEHELASPTFREQLQAFSTKLHQLSVAPDTHPALRTPANSCAVLIAQFFGAEGTTLYPVADDDDDNGGVCDDVLVQM